MERGDEGRVAELVGLGLAWGELEVGYQFRAVGRTVTEADLVNFVSMTGMQGKQVYDESRIVKDERSLSEGVIKEWHALLTRH